MNLDLEIKTFEANREKLVTEFKDRFVLIKGNEILGNFGAYEDALAEGYKRFGNEEFLVKQVKEDELVNFFARSFSE